MYHLGGSCGIMLGKNRCGRMGVGLCKVCEWLFFLRKKSEKFGYLKRKV